MKRRFQQRGIDVVVDESGDMVDLRLNGVPIDVSKIDGAYHSQTANQFIAFETLDELIDTLARNEGRYWKLEGATDDGMDGDHGHM